MKLLHVDSSILGDHSVSRQLSSSIVAKLRATVSDLEVTYRDLAADPIPHLSGTTLSAQIIPAEQHSPTLQRDLAVGAQALEEFLAADIIVLGVPMYNFAIPSQLKTWIDRITVAGKTFRYSEKGAEGLAGEKRLIVASSQGGFYGPDTPGTAMDHQEAYLRTLFGFLGIANIEFIRAAGTNIGPDQKAASIEAARHEIAALAA